MRVDQAIYGESRGGHALLAASGAQELASELTFRLDLPDTAPPGVEWSPYVSGFPYRDRFILARIIRDVQASRSGMVFSHALIVPLGDVATLNSLSALLGLLHKSPVRSQVVSSLEVDVSANVCATDSPEIALAADALATKGNGPVVRLGNVGFEDLVTSLWMHLPPDIRRRFAFRLSFSPNDLVDKPTPAIVCTPAVQVGRWSGHRIVGQGGMTPSRMTASLLRGEAEGSALIVFGSSMGASLETCSDLVLLEQARSLTTDASLALDEVVRGARLIGKLSPIPTSGEAEKHVLIARLSSLIASASPEQILLVRNLSLAAFSDSSQFRNALSTWAADNRYAPDIDQGVLEVVADSMVETHALPEWREAILEGFGAALRSQRSNFARAFWRWIGLKPSVTAMLFRHLPSDSNAEFALAKAAPESLSVNSFEALRQITLDRGLLSLHGAAASAAYEPGDAVRFQISVDQGPGDGGLRMSLRRATPAQVLSFALDLKEARLVRLAVDAVVANPGLLAEVDLTDWTAQSIWAQSLRLNPNAWLGPKDPKGSLGLILDLLLSGAQVVDDLLSALVMSPLADLNDLPRRSAVWARLSGATLSGFLSATAAGWLRARQAGISAGQTEAELQGAVLRHSDLDAILGSGVVSTAVHLAIALDGFGEDRFVRWLRDMVGRVRSVDTVDAEAIGSLVLRRNWGSCAEFLVELYNRGRRDFKPALRVCHSLLELWTRFWLGVTAISPDEKWALLEDVAASLYPGGPDHNQLWERAGGRDKDLVHHGVGAARWRAALSEIRRGRGVEASSLLREMRRDYHANERLRYLAEDPEFGRHR